MQNWYQRSLKSNAGRRLNTYRAYSIGCFIVWAVLITVGVLNSETARLRVAPLQSRGQWGARDLDKLMLSLPLPSFDPGVDLHRRLAEAARQAEAITAGLELTGLQFVKARQTIRAALVTAGVAVEIDALVRMLLGDAPVVAVEPTLDGDLEVVEFDEDELEEDETIQSEDADDGLIDA